MAQAAQSPEQNQPHKGSPESSEPLPAIEIDVFVGELGNARETANPVPHLAAIRGEGIPVILHEGAEAPQDTGSHRRGSDAGTEVSRITSVTIWDRGESQYRAENPLGFPEPANGDSQSATAGSAHESLAASVKDLVKRLVKLETRPCRCNGTAFYPRRELEALITPKEVAQVIAEGRRRLEEANKRLADDEIHEYAARVCREALPGGTEVSYKRMFAILLLNRRGWEIVLFVDGLICDAELPLKAVKVGDELKMRRQSEPETDLPCLRNWDELEHRDFEEKQWRMLAPFLAKGDRRSAWFYQLSDQDVLPWTRKESSVREGGYGSISKVEIHPSHHNFERGNGVFAIKEFKPVKSPPTPGADLSKDFEREIEILMRFSGDVHPHLISLQAAYRHGDTYCVILPWAECDLKHLWKNSSLQKPLRKLNLLWMLGQCAGIASGLQNIHRYQTTETATDEKADASRRNNRIFGRHGDIKPENILLFRDRTNSQDLGRLVLSDFGLSRFHSEITKTYFTKKDILTTITYRPPECDMDGRNVSRSFDIWSLGCVLLEFVAWYLGGWNLVQAFVERRKLKSPLYGWPVDDFFEIVRQEKSSRETVYVRVKREVHDFINNELHAHPCCSEPVHELLDFVVNRMLVVELPGYRIRADCGEVHMKLEELYETVSRLTKLEATPRSKVESIPEAVEMPLDSHVRQMAQSRYMELREHTGRTLSL
ncbi:hypothetical protein C8A03DRAFT_15762 [Achaetomium macrosporum]|uniref:Protein kinase domain-containing protein n=1 Tax=Achaetomium macrosporum TaxID=79813 RepID=A0AAN7C944_9PEZI|nr:hypothetical protein C8A03DRAFT_15762 [Achaetomium macrosporum]